MERKLAACFTLFICLRDVAALPLKPEQGSQALRILPVAPPGVAPPDLPYPYIFEIVTGASVSVDASLVTHWDGYDKDNVIHDIVGSGPVPWSISRWNKGDVAMRIQPRRPYAQSNLGVAPGIKGFSTADPKHFAAQAWRPHRDRGVTLATVAQNGQQWADGQARFYGTVAASTDSGGYGYSMIDGTFGHDDPSLDINIGAAGKRDEADIDFGVAWFPYAQGWTGGFVAAPSGSGAAASWQGAGSHSADLPGGAHGVVSWTESGARLRLQGVPAPHKDGLLFAISTDPGGQNSAVNTVSVLPGDQDWLVQLREDDEADPAKLAAPSQWMFAFLYIPYSAGGLVGGHVAGGHMLQGAGLVTCRRVAEGQYELSINGQQTSRRDGMLLLQVAGEEPSRAGYAAAAFLSYNHTEAGTVLVEARTYTGASGLREGCPLSDTDFYFAWVDFHSPLRPAASANAAAGRAAAGNEGHSLFGTGFVAGVLVTAVMGCVTWVVLKALYDKRPYHRGVMVPLSELDGVDLEQDLLPSTESYFHDEGGAAEA